MTGSDSTPDFSWLKENDEAAESASNTGGESKNSPGAESDAEDANTEEALQKEETTREPSEKIEVPSDSTEDESANSNTLSEDATSQPGIDIAENSSVFDETEEEQTDRDSDSNGPTILMPGRQLHDDLSDHLQSEFDDDEETIVLESENAPPPKTDLVTSDPSGEDSGNSDAMSDEAPGQSIPPLPSDEQNAANSSSVDQASNKVETSGNGAPNEKSSSEKSNLKFLLLASYASAVTIVALMLMMRSGQSASPHHLESLPDVAPEPADELSYVPVKATLPPGHRLKLGEKQRFGNIEVEPFKIVKEPLEFTHYSGNGDLTRPGTAPVYKLWLKFTNVSENQEIAPLDGTLLLRWVRNSEKQREYANYYIFSDGSEDDADLIETYRHSKTSDWDLQNQKLGHVLKPGESYETYIPSMEGLSGELPENANWRLQFRKGYSPSGNGVTTIIDVAFRSEEVDSST